MATNQALSLQLLERSAEKGLSKGTWGLGAAAIYHQLGKYSNILNMGMTELKHGGCMSVLCVRGG